MELQNLKIIDFEKYDIIEFAKTTIPYFSAPRILVKYGKDNKGNT